MTITYRHLRAALIGLTLLATTGLLAQTGIPPGYVPVAVVPGSANQVIATSGSAATPPIGFAAEAGMGWYRAGSGNMAAAIGGTSILSVTATGITLNAANAAYTFGSNKLFILTAPTISSGFGTSPSIVSSNGTATFRVNVGTGGVATSGVIGLPTATTGWNCLTTDITNSTAARQTADTTTTVTITAAAAWAASDVLLFQCVAF